MSELSLYQAAVAPAHGITFGSRVQLHKGGWRGVLLDDAGHEIDRAGARWGSRAKSTASLDARHLKQRYEHHFRYTGKRLEVERREQAAARQERKAASLARRKAMTSDRLAIYGALRDLVEVVESALDAGLFLSVDGKRPDVMALERARPLVEAHAQAAREIEADPANERGGRSK